jgi:hypothetical protein
VGPAGPEGPAGPADITREEFDALIARVVALEAQAAANHWPYLA